MEAWLLRNRPCRQVSLADRHRGREGRSRPSSSRMEDEDMAGKTPIPVEREAMIREAAYFHYAQRGYAPGHDLDDWLAAEAELEGIPSEPREPELPDFPPDI